MGRALTVLSDNLSQFVMQYEKRLHEARMKVVHAAAHRDATLKQLQQTRTELESELVMLRRGLAPNPQQLPWLPLRRKSTCTYSMDRSRTNKMAGSSADATGSMPAQDVSLGASNTCTPFGLGFATPSETDSAPQSNKLASNAAGTAAGQPSGLAAVSPPVLVQGPPPGPPPLLVPGSPPHLGSGSSPGLSQGLHSGMVPGPPPGSAAGLATFPVAVELPPHVQQEHSTVDTCADFEDVVPVANPIKKKSKNKIGGVS